jgi:site-specific DNA-methyltransferase (adenine-specific)
MSRPIQKYQETEIVLYYQDCLEGVQQLAANTVDVVITDPPYGCGTTINGKGITPDDMRNLAPFYEMLFREWARVLKPDGEVYMFLDWRSISFFYPILSRFMDIKNLITWDKKSGPGNRYSFRTEFMLYGIGTQHKQSKKGTNLWRSPCFCSGAKKEDGNKVHPTQKPTRLIRHALYQALKEKKGVVLDCFAGSASVGVACKQLGHKYIGFEFNPDFYKTAVERLQNTQFVSGISTDLEPA